MVRRALGRESARGVVGIVELFQPPRQTYVTGNDSAGTSPSQSTNTKASLGDIGGSVLLRPAAARLVPRGRAGPRITAKKKALLCRASVDSGGGIRTRDLRVMRSLGRGCMGTDLAF